MGIRVASMLTSGGSTKLAYTAISNGCGDVVIPRQTLLSRFKTAKARLEVVCETHDVDNRDKSSIGGSCNKLKARNL